MSFIVMGLCEDCFKSNVQIDSCQLSVMLNGYSQWLNIKGGKQFYRDISSIDISDAGIQS